MRHLVIVLGDQLSRSSAAFDGFDREQDAIWMAEVEEELTHVWCHKLRIAFFLSAMRHFRDGLEKDGCAVYYHQLRERKEDDAGRDFVSVLEKSVRELKPEGLVVVEPGDYRVQRAFEQSAASMDVPLEVRADRHFFCGREEFAEYAKGRSLILEFFYRHMRKKHKVLMDDAGGPAGGAWNYDKQNRERLKVAPARELAAKRFAPDDVTRDVIALVERRFRDHPGSTEHFELPVTENDAQELLADFVERRLPFFGSFQDAMWTGQPVLYHSRLSALLNVKLLDPRACIAGAVKAYEERRAPLNSVEGFVRQILGWREFVHGIYWTEMPGYVEKNFLNHSHAVPHFFWDGETEMRCIRETMSGILSHGYANHIQRLMVMGLFALVYGVNPRAFHEWHMAMYLDAIDWVSLPNALGMSQYGDGGIIGTKPYCATGNYIGRMSNYCGQCRYSPKQATGETACPFTTLYYDFLDRHYDKLNTNPRLKFQLAAVARKRNDSHQMQQIRERVVELEAEWSTAVTGR